MNTQELLKSKYFCVQPFVHACVWTDGRALPCCINQSYVLGDTKTTPITEIYSNDNEKLVSLRKEMLNGPDLPESCSRCSIPENNYADNSYRYYSNKHYGHLIDNMQINDDGTIVDPKISTWDVRFSNLCNLKCRTCDSINSSKIAEEERKYIGKSIQVLKEAFDDTDEFFKFFESNIDSIEEIYFCGGESLLLEDHYKMLDILVANEKFDTVLRYNTNCTKIFFKDKNVVDNYWVKFKHLRLGLSLDAGWEQLFYIRHGSEWDVVLENLKYIVSKCPHAFMQLSPTISILNAFHVSKLHKFLVEQGIIELENIYFNILTFPDFYSITSLTPELKEQVKQHWEQYKSDVMVLGASDHVKSEIDKVIKYMYTQDQSHTLDNFRKDTELKDNLRKESAKDIFPELHSIL
jgi:MoaA/NifB/PqqE/SkfB family radical SAM enzyme